LKLLFKLYFHTLNKQYEKLNIKYSICGGNLFRNHEANAQWEPLPIQVQPVRYEDVFFLNNQLGWAVCVDHSYIDIPYTVFKSKDGGDTWEETAFIPSARCIEFCTPDLGFIGTLGSITKDTVLFRTVDGGETWENITHKLNPKPRSICGLAVVGTQHIYGSGAWHGYPYFIKSHDGGESWTVKDMSYIASALVDVFFLSKDTGFITGTGLNSEGGIILYTTDGGETWEKKFNTGISIDIVWKIQTPDRNNFFASVQGKDVKMIRSSDAGMSWSMHTIDSTSGHFMQMIGFVDSQKGWAGSKDWFYSTQDGGLTWNKSKLPGIKNYNRFYKVNDSLAFLSANIILRYNPNFTHFVEQPNKPVQIHTLSVSPNPAHDKLEIRTNIGSETYCLLSLYNSQGQLLKEVFSGPKHKGSYTYTVSLKQISAPIIYVVLRTHEGVEYTQIVHH
jgi:photosystem II stability/assembly factor-like uncharacterized protein